jgi:hypothetical protein
VRFHQLAACYDRAARTDARQSGANPGLAFHFHPDTWKPRLGAPGFTAAADWLSRTRPLRPAEPSDDPIAALDRGSAVVAVLSLAEVGRLPRDEKTGEVAARFKLAPLPGTRTYFDNAGKRKSAEQRANYVPYLGSGGWVGVVFKRSPARDAAWDLLAELGSPTAAAARLSDPHLGAGPYRTEHLDESRDQVWLRYGFDAARTRELGGALRRYVRPEVSNPALVLRTPDRAALMASLEAEVRKAATGALAPAEAMKQAQAAWQKHDTARPREELVRWRRNAIGLP